MSLELSLGLTVAFVLLGIMSGVPIGYIFGISCIIMFLMTANLDAITWLVPSSLKILQQFTMLALPLYIMVGSLLRTTFLAMRLFEFLRAILGRLRGAFGGAIVLFVAVFGAMSGSAASAIGAIGTLVIPEGTRYGYDKEYTSGLVANASLIAMLIPPSLTMIIFGIASRTSIPILFLATAVPGILTALFLIGLNFILTKRWKFTPIEQTPVTIVQEKGVLGKGITALPALAVPCIILGGIYGGVFTPTEAAAIAVAWIILYALVASIRLMFARKSISEFGAGLAGLRDGLIEAGRVIGAMGTICFFMFALSKAMVFVNVPGMIKEALVAAIPKRIIFLLVVNVILLIMGMIMDDVSCCILAAIILLPVALHFGVSPYHFGAIVGVNAGLGNLTPPVAPLLYFAAGIGDVPVKLYPPNRYVKTVAILLLFAQLPVLMLITYIPQLSLFLPNMWTAAR
jgi:C4-dicarboxylate transporter DctM subunit